jgi:hypothetical protein
MSESQVRERYPPPMSLTTLRCYQPARRVRCSIRMMIWIILIGKLWTGSKPNLSPRQRNGEVQRHCTVSLGHSYSCAVPTDRTPAPATPSNEHTGSRMGDYSPLTPSRPSRSVTEHLGSVSSSISRNLHDVKIDDGPEGALRNPPD